LLKLSPLDSAPRFLVRDRDGIYGERFREHIADMGIEEVVIAPRTPWQNPYCKRLVDSIRRECLDHIIVPNERHLMRILRSYFDYELNVQPHLSLNRNAPIERELEGPGPVKHRWNPARSIRSTPPSKSIRAAYGRTTGGIRAV